MITYTINKDDPYCFECKDDKGNIVQIQYITNRPNTIWKEDEFIFELLENPYLNGDSDIYDVYFDKEELRCGWIFPISLYDYEDVVEVKDIRAENFSNYLYVAFLKLLEKIEIIDVEKQVTSEKQRITDYFNKSSLVLLIINNHDGKYSQFKYDDYNLSFYRYGYMISNKNMEINPFYNINVRENIHKIHIHKNQSNIIDNELINKLIFKELPNANNELYRFILLYQVIEYLIDLRQQQEIKKILDEYKIQNEDIREIIIQIKNITTEKTRIQLLFDEKPWSRNIKDQFIDVCKSLFVNAKITLTDFSLSTYVYTLRNYIFHSYRRLIGFKDDLLKAIFYFEKLIIELLINIKQEELEIQ